VRYRLSSQHLMLFATLVTPSNTVFELEEKNSRKPTYFMLALHEYHSGMSSHDSDVLLSDPLLYVVTTALFSAWESSASFL